MSFLSLPLPDRPCFTPNCFSCRSWRPCRTLRFYISKPWAHSLAIGQPPISIWPTIAEELPGVAHGADQFHVEVVDDQFVLVAAGDLFDLAARVDEVALAVELTDIPRRFGADAVDGADPADRKSTRMNSSH